MDINPSRSMVSNTASSPRAMPQLYRGDIYKSGPGPYTTEYCHKMSAHNSGAPTGYRREFSRLKGPSLTIVTQGILVRQRKRRQVDGRLDQGTNGPHGVQGPVKAGGSGSFPAHQGLDLIGGGCRTTTPASRALSPAGHKISHPFFCSHLHQWIQRREDPQPHGL